MIFTYNQKRYLLSADNYPQTLLQAESPFPELYCIVHPVEQGYQTELNLTALKEEGHLYVTLPLKPTNASSITVFTSVAGGADTYQGEIDLAKNPVNAVLKQAEYSVQVLPIEKVKGLMEEGDGSFEIKLLISGGPLGNAIRGRYTYSLPVVWNGKSAPVYPGKPSNNNGSGGNPGNVGTDNSGGGGGVRPGVNNTPTPSPEPETKPEEEIPTPSPEPETKPEEETPIIPSEPDVMPKEEASITPAEPDIKRKEEVSLMSLGSDTKPKEEVLTMPLGAETENELKENTFVPSLEKDTESKNNTSENLLETEVSSESEPLSFKKEVVAVSTIGLAAAGVAAVKSGILAKLIAAISKLLHL